jgi:hypothetical protein
MFSMRTKAFLQHNMKKGNFRYKEEEEEEEEEKEERCTFQI